MNEETFQKEILALEAEIYALKTVSRISPSVKCYTASFTPINGLNPIKITYSSGSNAIITDFYSYSGTFIPCEPDNNLQYVLYTASSPTIVYIVSTRPIISVTQDAA